jgi:hypothetical protein
MIKIMTNDNDTRTNRTSMRRFALRKKTALVLAISGAAILQSSVWAAKEPEAAGGPSVTRRLTESQYRASVADIFAADIPIVGRFERGLRSEGLLSVGASEAGMSAFSVEQYEASALGIAAEVVSAKRRAQLVPCKPASETAFDKACAKQFVEHYGTQLFRRPLSAAESQRFVETVRLAQERLGNFYSGLEFALAGMMMEPDFLLRIEKVERDAKSPGQFRLDAYSKATRLSYFLTNSTPDQELLRAAGAGELDTQAGLERQVDRLMAAPRFVSAVRAFFADMLQFDLFDDVAKDPVIFPVYNSVVAADAQEETLRTIIDHLLTQKGDYRDLFTLRTTFLTRALGRVYKMPVATRNGWEKAEFPSDSGRAGIVTDASFLALHSHPGRSSPTLRGKAIREIFMCQQVPDPPADVNFTTVNLGVGNKTMPTMRLRLEGHRSQPYCAGCHVLMDPLGLTLENFDGAGSFRTHENDTLIDVSGSLDGQPFTGPSGLGQALHDAPQTSNCLVDKMYRTAVGRTASPSEQKFVEDMYRGFEHNGHRVPDLMRAIAVSKTFYSVSPPSNKEGGKDRVASGRESSQRSGEKS